MMSEVWREYSGGVAVQGVGVRALWERRAQWTGVLCSRRVPASLILAAQDFANAAARDEQSVFVSGWQSPVEQEIFRILRRENAPLIGVAAREIAGARLPRAWREAVEGGTMAVVSPFPDAARLTRKRAVQRNRWILENCPRVIVPHAAPGGELHALLLEILQTPGAPRIEVFAHELHAKLLQCGAQACPYP